MMAGPFIELEMPVDFGREEEKLESNQLALFASLTRPGYAPIVGYRYC